MDLAEAFLARLPIEARTQHRDREVLERELTAAVERSRAAWPTVVLAPDVFAGHLAHHCATAAVGPSELRVTDLYLACACAVGIREALVAFEAVYFPDIVPALVRATRDTALEDEVAQELRGMLFLPRERGAPQLALYAGRGDLRNWTRTAIGRVILNLLTRRPKEVPVESDLLSAFAHEPGGGDVELAHMKETYRAEFAAAFEVAVDALSSRERNLLRHAFVDGLTVDAIGALYGAHRATAARWVAAARAKLMGGVRKGLMQRLHVDGAEFNSIMRLIRSRLDLTLRRHLAPRSLEEPEG